jgi:hypothetical protein
MRNKSLMDSSKSDDIEIILRIIIDGAKKPHCSLANLIGPGLAQQENSCKVCDMLTFFHQD